MNISNTQSDTDPAYRKFHRACLALCIVLAPAVLFLGFAFDPTGGVGVPSSASVLAAALGKFGASASNAAIVHYVSSQGAILSLAGSWVIGHLLGYIFLGIAFIRSRAIPLWASCLFIVGIPFQAVGYATHHGILQLICFALIFIGSIPPALAMLKMKDRQALIV